MRRSYKGWKYTKDYEREVEKHKVGFRHSSIACPECGGAIPLKYRGEEADSESFHLGRCDDCYVKTAEEFKLYYKYNCPVK